jgi:preprotein translocase subunit SecA
VKKNVKSGFSEKAKDFWRKLSGVPVEINLDPYRAVLRRIEEIRTGELAGADERYLRRRAETLQGRAAEAISLDPLLPEAFALAAEVSQRQIGLDPHDVQIIAGVAMHRRKIAELPTGEGKTLAAVFPAFLNALSGRGFHVLTFNDYLARRDAAWMEPIYTFMGLTVGCIQEGMSPTEKKKAYGCDITYATAKEAGFDFLRDELCYRQEDRVLRPFHFALVDEADSILIDEARIPLVIAGALGAEEGESRRLAEVARGLRAGIDYEMDPEKRNIFLTDGGIRRVEKMLGWGNLFSPDNSQFLAAVHCALHAAVLLARDKDYIVRNGKIEIVDEFTGRVVEKRHWPDGLQAAVEAKENLPASSQGRVLGSITLQHFFQQYPSRCGMTATAVSAADEFSEFYGLPVVVMPPYRPCIRQDKPDYVFRDKESKQKALLDEIIRMQATGRPILVGTASVKESDNLAEALRREGVGCHVLNAKNDEREAEIIAQAGDLGAVTISTNMAGRGTDIRLGGKREENRASVASLGGLYVIGTNRHESVRIDRQLRGRAGRQGDPGSSRFFVSLEDDLVVRYGLRRQIQKFLAGESAARRAVESRWVNREIDRAQRIIEGQNFDIRKTLWKYSSLVEAQREIIHGWRGDILGGESSPGLLKKNAPRVFASLRSAWGESRLRELERQIILVRLDMRWADHLAYLTDLRESIHLVKVGGQKPLEEFHKLATEAFLRVRGEIEAEVVTIFRRLAKQKDRPEPSPEALKGPSSTWTYLVNDDQFGWGISMIQGGSIGYAAAAAAMWGPLYLFLGIYHRYFKKKQDSG